jgi:hypothetical protein
MSNPFDTMRAKCRLKGHFLQKRLQMTSRLQSIDSSQKTEEATTTDYGRPMKPFFIEIQNLWAWPDNLGR